MRAGGRKAPGRGRELGRVPVKLMHKSAANSVAPSPRAWGGEREQTELAASSDLN